MQEHPQYIAKTGSDAKDRLALQHRVFAPGTQRLLQLTNFQPDMRVLVLGCGCGDETIMIAQQMNERGQIVAIDISVEQLKQAAAAAKEAHQDSKITFKNKAIEAIDASDGSFDLIIGRFILPHLKNLPLTIEQLKQRLKSNGKIASQEPIVSSCYAIPSSPSLNEYLQLMMSFAEANGLDFDMATTIPDLFAESSLKTMSERWQPTVTGSDKRMVTMSAIECFPMIIKAGLVDAATADALIQGINAEVVEPEGAVLVQCDNVLTVGTL